MRYNGYIAYKERGYIEARARMGVHRRGGSDDRGYPSDHPQADNGGRAGMEATPPPLPDIEIISRGLHGEAREDRRQVAWQISR